MQSVLEYIKERYLDIIFLEITMIEIQSTVTERYAQTSSQQSAD